MQDKPNPYICPSTTCSRVLAYYRRPMRLAWFCQSATMLQDRQCPILCGSRLHAGTSDATCDSIGRFNTLACTSCLCFMPSAKAMCTKPIRTGMRTRPRFKDSPR